MPTGPVSEYLSQGAGQTSRGLPYTAADLWTGTMTSEEPEAARVRVWPLQSLQLSRPAEEGKASGTRSKESG